jgi:hypothetical protein
LAGTIAKGKTNIFSPVEIGSLDQNINNGGRK